MMWSIRGILATQKVDFGKACNVGMTSTKVPEACVRYMEHACICVLYMDDGVHEIMEVSSNFCG